MALLAAGAIALGGAAEGASSAATLARLQVEYSETPLGIDVETPRFGWQMSAPEGERGYAQSAYRIVVSDPRGSVV
jgi:alpha-L-rhamnosidase